MSSSGSDIEDEEEKHAIIKPYKINDALTTSRSVINNMKTILLEGKGKISINQKEKLNDGMEELFDIIAHLVAEKNEMKGELKILRPLTKIYTKNFDEIKQVMQENKSLFINMENKNDEN